MTTTALPSQQQFVFEDADWAFYETVLRNVGDRHVFVTYDRGRMEIMSPSYKHDLRARFIVKFIDILSEELNIGVRGAGSTTFKRADLGQGLEADAWFYIQNIDKVLGKDEIDLTFDPPPDLAIEVEISRRVGKRLEIYASLGIRELWRDDGEHVRVLVLGADGVFQERPRSECFPMLPPRELDRLLALAPTMRDNEWTRLVRQWVKETL